MAKALHYVFKIANRQASYDFYCGLLGMKVLRHEEFTEGCAAECNGPYNGWWSKTMVGYGPEDEHFVLELTYNYDIGGYTLGNDFRSISIKDKNVYSRVSGSKNCTKDELNRLLLKDPDGHLFVVSNEEAKYPLTNVALNVSDLCKAMDFWRGKLNMEVLRKSSRLVELSYGQYQAHLELHKIMTPINRASAYGRIAFSFPKDQLKAFEEKMKNSEDCTILKPYVTLETPGKASVEVVILADPDQHEICFVGDEGFWNLAKVDPNAEADLLKQIKRDTSAEHFAGGKKFV